MLLQVYALHLVAFFLLISLFETKLGLVAPFEFACSVSVFKNPVLYSCSQDDSDSDGADDDHKHSKSHKRHKSHRRHHSVSGDSGDDEDHAPRKRHRSKR